MSDKVKALLVEWEANAQRSLESAERGGLNWTEHMTRRTTWQAAARDLRAALAAPTPCPVCGGAGIVDTSPPGVETAPWLQTDTDCPACADTEDTP